MTFSEAAVEILRLSSEPLTAEQIVEEALRRRLIQSTGKTPVQTMRTALYVKRPEGVVRVFKKGPSRALRSSVRWRLAQRQK